MGWILAIALLIACVAVAALLAANVPEMDRKAHGEAMKLGSAHIELFYPVAFAHVFSIFLAGVAVVIFIGLIVKASS